MLCINNYSQDYINECRASMDAQLAAYSSLVNAARAEVKSSAGQSAIDTFEPVFFNNLVLLLDALFVHRSRMLELKDGNPLNEVRVLCDSIVHNSRKMAADKSIKLDPKRSVLGYRAGDEIKLTEADFRRLADAFFAEIERKYREVEVAAEPAS